MRMLVLLAVLPFSAHAQWAIQDAHTTADLRGIDNVGGGVAWASGTNGTVLRTEDAGFVWQLCATPPGAEKLDFRGIQAFDNNTAIVMSSGKGDLSRLYKTTDGCQTWKLVFTNPDVDGFWDAIAFDLRPFFRSPPKSKIKIRRSGFVIGDPVDGKFVIYQTNDSGDHWTRWRDDKGEGPAKAEANESLFAASNSSLIAPGMTWLFSFVTGGPMGARLFTLHPHNGFDHGTTFTFDATPLPLPKGSSAGAFSIACGEEDRGTRSLMIVGGDYETPDSSTSSSFVAPQSFFLHARVATSAVPPHGYRSSVAYDAATKTWITVGPNGTDISTDDGRNWRALRPLPGEAPDTDQHWNALSLPFVVGPKGRIGVLESQALKAAK